MKDGSDLPLTNEEVHGCMALFCAALLGLVIGYLLGHHVG